MLRKSETNVFFEDVGQPSIINYAAPVCKGMCSQQVSMEDKLL